MMRMAGHVNNFTVPGMKSALAVTFPFLADPNGLIVGSIPLPQVEVALIAEFGSSLVRRNNDKILVFNVRVDD